MPFFTFLILFILSNHSLLTNANDGNNTTSIANSTASAAPLAVARTAAAFKPGIAAAVGILTTMFSITFLVLLYVKHCKGSSYNMNNGSRGYPPSRRDSGINRKVISSLPMFRFSSLRGQKEGLECAVCLNRFAAEEVLRLLPKCKHAFHVECVDTWLEAHSTCPLCRYRVDPEDVLLVDHSALATPRTSDHRVSGRHSSAGERGTVRQLIAERGRASLDSRKTGEETQGRKGKAGRKDGQLPLKEDRRRLEHRIIISAQEEELRRWSDVQAADFLYLRSEMLLGVGGEGMSGSAVINGRSVSEITGISRYRGNNGGKEERERQEEGLVKRWLAWISQSQHHHNPAVQSATSASPSHILL